LALQWDLPIAGGGTAIISKDRFLTVPEPSSLALFSVGLASQKNLSICAVCPDERARVIARRNVEFLWGHLMKTLVRIAAAALVALALLLLAFPNTDLAHFAISHLAHPLDPEQPISVSWGLKAGLMTFAAACMLLMIRWPRR